ncbi:MAG: hypothetical protein JXB49_34565 [Bacteroidales bacterium]|nr:hypothetical protein [Bacteroidales bacterium]
MTKEEFLQNEISDLKEIFKKHGSITPTFTLFLNDGSTESIALIIDKKSYKLFMQRICENPKVVAAIFITEAWISCEADETKAPSECDDKEEIIMLLYNTRDNIHLCHIYKPSKNGELDSVEIYADSNGKLSNPFGSVKNLTRVERQNAIQQFQETIRDTMCKAFEKLHYVVPMMYYLSNTPEQVSLCYIPQDEWMDRISLKQKISSKCAELETLAFMMEFPEDPDLVKIILVADEIHEIYNYKINTESQTLEFIGKGNYDGEFSKLFKN